MNYCPGCLREGHTTYCGPCRRILFDGKKVDHILPFSRPDFDLAKLSQSGRLSISGIQVKHSLRLEGNRLSLTEEMGEYILKPVPRGTYLNLSAVPANEHVTMQTASQVFKIKTAANALIFFSDGEMAYITKRFDVTESGHRLLQEDFAQIMQRTQETHGRNYKYESSYEEIAFHMKKHIGAYAIEAEKFFRLVLFNYLVSNGDAHLKNFSLQRNSEFGDYLLTPAYDLMNTSLHVPGESDTALKLFSGNYTTEAYEAGSKYTRADFYEFALKIMAPPVKSRIDKILKEIVSHEEGIKDLVQRSFLPDDLKTLYLASLELRRERLLS